MFGKKAETNIDSNELEFRRMKGIGIVYYSIVTSKVVFEENRFLVERLRKIFYVKGKTQNDAVDYGSIEKVEVKTNFALIDLIYGLVIGGICLVGGEVLWGLVALALFLFCSYGKKITVTRKDASKMVIQSDGIGQRAQIEAFRKKLGEKGVAV